MQIAHCPVAYKNFSVRADILTRIIDALHSKAIYDSSSCGIEVFELQSKLFEYFSG